jgi:hypothetical protein
MRLLIPFLAGTILLAGCASPSAPVLAKTPVPVPTSATALGYKVLDSSGRAYYVFLNAGTVTKTFTADADLTSAQVLADQTSAGTDPIAHPVGVAVAGRTVTLAPGTSAILKN